MINIYKIAIKLKIDTKLQVKVYVSFNFSMQPTCWHICEILRNLTILHKIKIICGVSLSTVTSPYDGKSCAIHWKIVDA